MTSTIRMGTLFAGATLVVVAAACSSKSNNTTSTSATTGPTTASASSASGTGGAGSTSSASGTGGAGGTSCTQTCINNNPDAAKKFEGYELQECGCAANAPCAMQCKNNCPSMVPAQNDPCGQCLLGEAAKKTNSPCTLKAATADCQPDPMCAPFLQCVLACP